MIRERIKMLLSRFLPGHCSHESDRLRRAASLHAVSVLAVKNASQKVQRRASDLQITADAAERRARERGVVLAVEDALRLPSFGGPGDGED